MTDRPLALDLFCGAGGASMGLYRAGFDVIGVDIVPQKRYPFTFVQGNALNPPFDLARFDFVWASPPCQSYSILGQLPWNKGKTYPKLIEPVRHMLQAARQWCIENVKGAPLQGVELCGQMFGLPLYRHRLFETSFFLLAPTHARHREVIGNRRIMPKGQRGTLNASSSRGSWGKGGVVTVAGHQFKRCDGVRALDIDWMTRDEMAQSIPPAYSEFIGRAALRYIGKAAA